MGKKGIGKYVEDYLAFLSVERGLAQNTINSYRGHLGEFFFEYKADASARVDEGTIRRFMGQNLKRGISGATIGRKLAPIRGYFAFLHREGLIDRDPAKIIEYPKREKKLPEYLSEKQVEDLLAIIEDPRDKAIVETLYASGIRAGELLNLKNKDLDLEEMTLRIREAKNGQERIAYLNKSAVDALRRYKGLDCLEDPFFRDLRNSNSVLGLFIRYGQKIKAGLRIRDIHTLTKKQTVDIRKSIEFSRDRVVIEFLLTGEVQLTDIVALKNGDVDFDKRTIRLKSKPGEQVSLTDQAFRAIKAYKMFGSPEEHVFIFKANRGNGKGTRAGLNLILKKYADKLGFHIYPHMLRHSFATHMLNNGSNVMVVKELLGHVSINSTMIYTHVAKEKLQEDHKKLETARPKKALIPIPRYDAEQHIRQDLIKRFKQFEKEKCGRLGFLSVEETSWLLDCSNTTITMALRKGKIPRVDQISDGKNYIRKDLLLRFQLLVGKRPESECPRALSLKETEWVLGVSRPLLIKAIKKREITAIVMGEPNGVPYQIDAGSIWMILNDPPGWLIKTWHNGRKIEAESIWKLLSRPPEWLVKTWEVSGQYLSTRRLSSEDWAKKAYRIFKESGKLPYPNANQTASNRGKYYSTGEMAAKLGISETKYQQIKPIVDILFETEKNIKNELVIQAVQAQFDKKVAHRANKRLPDPQGEVLDAEYQVSEV